MACPGWVPVAIRRSRRGFLVRRIVSGPSRTQRRRRTFSLQACPHWVLRGLRAAPESVAFHAQLLGQQRDANRDPETKSDPVWTEAAVAYRRTLAFSDAADALAFAPRGRVDAGTGLGAEIDLNG